VRIQRIAWQLFFVLVALVASPTTHALQFYYDENRDADLKACDAHRYVGHSDQADRCYGDLATHDSVLVQAQAAAALQDVRRANRLFREASRNSTHPEIKTSWGYLFLSTHQIEDAVALFREALLIGSNYYPARLGLAKALTTSFSGEARKELSQILEESPNHPGALLEVARLELENKNTEVARRIIDTAIPFLEDYGIPPLEAYALHASADLLDAKPSTSWEKKALAINPRYAEVYSIPARSYIITYRYREAVALYQSAVRINPELAIAQRDLGINLLRVNDVFGARHHLSKAFELDPYDVQTINTLRFLDGLDEMRVTVLDVDDDSGNPLGRVLVRLDEEDADALEPYVLDIAERAMRTFSERYDFKLIKPMIIELYHDHDDFGVRTVSTPGIGLLGVTFGYLTAMDSPKARVVGEFHWGSTLWHEIAHVYTLEATNHLLPRWMSEGLSVYEEWNTGPLQDRMLSFDVLSAIRDEELLPIESLDLGFVRPQYQGQVQVSYAQAGLLCDFISDNFGHEALVSLVKSFAKNSPLEDAIQTATGMTPVELDEAFFTFLDLRYGELARSLDDYSLVSREAARAIDNQDWAAAETIGADLIQRYPEYIAADSGYDVLDAAYIAQDKVDAMIDNRWAWFERGGHHPDQLKKLAADLRTVSRFEDSVAVMEALNWVMPYSPEEHALLGEHYLQQADSKKALREFNALLAVSETNPAEAYLGRARAAVLDNELATARKEVLYALEASPFYRPAQNLLLDMHTGNTQ